MGRYRSGKYLDETSVWKVNAEDENLDASASDIGKGDSGVCTILTATSNDLRKPPSNVPVVASLEVESTPFGGLELLAKSLAPHVAWRR